MNRKWGTLKIACMLALCFAPAAMACCGHCYHGGVKMHKSTASLSNKESAAVEKFSEENSDLLAKLEKNKQLITDEYEKKNPDYDKIAKLKKQGIDYHTEWEKRLAKEKLHHHPCWCPMHK